jgi:translation elongation factor P/translation initiation factor 5A
MARKRPAPAPQPEQLVLPLQLRIGDVVLEEGTRLEVVDRPTTVSGGKLTRVVVRNAALNVRDERHWDAWRKVKVVRRAA